MTSSQLLQQAMDAEGPKFDRMEPRVSKIGLCSRRQVMEALGMIQNDISWDLCEAGHILQEAAFRRIRKIYPLTEEEPAIETCVAGVYCHSDIIVPELKLCIQVKSAIASRETWGTIAQYQRDQCILEWDSWQRSKCYKRYSRTKGYSTATYPFVPERYEILFLDRETYGRIFTSVSVPWDRRRAAKLKEKFEDIAWHIAEGLVPEVPKTTQADCWLGRPCSEWNNCEG